MGLEETSKYEIHERCNSYMHPETLEYLKSYNSDEFLIEYLFKFLSGTAL